MSPEGCRLLFVDTEFTDFIDTCLLSIGLVSDCGQVEFYRERRDWDGYRVTDFVRSNVIPLLGPESQRLDRCQLAEQLHDFLVGFAATGKVGIVVDFEGDWQLLVDALEGYDWPSNIYPKPLRIREVMNAPEFVRAFLGYYVASGSSRHHSLSDAHANRAGWMALPEDSREEIISAWLQSHLSMGIRHFP